MNDRNILLTYIRTDGLPTYEWFEDLEECNEFISNSKNIIRKLMECVDCTNAQEIELNELVEVKE